MKKVTAKNTPKALSISIKSQKNTMKDFEKMEETGESSDEDFPRVKKVTSKNKSKVLTRNSQKKKIEEIKKTEETGESSLTKNHIMKKG